MNGDETRCFSGNKGKLPKKKIAAKGCRAEGSVSGNGCDKGERVRRSWRVVVEKRWIDPSKVLASNQRHMDGAWVASTLESECQWWPPAVAVALHQQHRPCGSPASWRSWGNVVGRLLGDALLHDFSLNFPLRGATHPSHSSTPSHQESVWLHSDSGSDSVTEKCPHRSMHDE